MFRQSIEFDQGQQLCTFDREPDQCPICHNGIEPPRCYYHDLNENEIEIVFRCPKLQCLHLFIGQYQRVATPTREYKYGLRASLPRTPRAPLIPESVDATIPEFREIYSQAAAAEDGNLTEICGAGYRRGLEFLIKGYLLRNASADDAAQIRKLLLGTCIQNFVTNENLKQVARRAAWLGNDETHYERRWVDQDLNDLKAAIRLTLSWIDTELLTEKLLAEMPDGGPNPTQPDAPS